MVNIGPKKGGGFVVVPLNYGGGHPIPKSCMHLDKSGTLPTDVSTQVTNKDARAWVQDTNDYERSLTQRKGSCTGVTKQGYTIRLSRSKDYSQPETDNET
jgi:hypothetical protein